MNGFYITIKGEKVILEPSDTIDVSYKDIVELVIPNGAKCVYCNLNKLTKLYLPDSVEYIDCRYNQLTELILNDNVEEVDCTNNNLTELGVPDSVNYIYCDSKVIQMSKLMYNRSNRLKQILK